METYEFQASLSDGVIQIPLEFRSKLSGKIKVILMQDDVAHKKPIQKEAPKKTSFPYYAIDTTGYVFNREEANER